MRHEEAEVAPDNIARRASAGAGRVMEAARAAAGHSAGSSAPESGISKVPLLPHPPEVVPRSLAYMT